MNHIPFRARDCSVKPAKPVFWLLGCGSRNICGTRPLAHRLGARPPMLKLRRARPKPTHYYRLQRPVNYYDIILYPILAKSNNFGNPNK
jgi:hypothetical protein